MDAKTESHINNLRELNTELLTALGGLTSDITSNSVLMDNVSLAAFEAACAAIERAEGDAIPRPVRKDGGTS